MKLGGILRCERRKRKVDLDIRSLFGSSGHARFFFLTRKRLMNLERGNDHLAITSG